jgi:hypothetical protein
MFVMPHRYNKVGTVNLSIVMCTKVDPNDVAKAKAKLYFHFCLFIFEKRHP